MFDIIDARCDHEVHAVYFMNARYSVSDKVFKINHLTLQMNLHGAS